MLRLVNSIVVRVCVAAAIVLTSGCRAAIASDWSFLVVACSCGVSAMTQTGNASSDHKVMPKQAAILSRENNERNENGPALSDKKLIGWIPGWLSGVLY